MLGTCRVDSSVGRWPLLADEASEIKINKTVTFQNMYITYVLPTYIHNGLSFDKITYIHIYFFQRQKISSCVHMLQAPPFRQAGTYICSR
jgi:hypothetical protein